MEKFLVVAYWLTLFLDLVADFMLLYHLLPDWTGSINAKTSNSYIHYLAHYR